MSLNASFKFVSKNPPSLLIGGGILLIVMSTFMSTDTELQSLGMKLIALGFILQCLWLFRREIGKEIERTGREIRRIMRKKF